MATYRAGLTTSGLLIEIEAFEGETSLGYVQIDRVAWPSVVESVNASMLAHLVDAQINTATGGADEEAEN